MSEKNLLDEQSHALPSQAEALESPPPIDGNAADIAGDATPSGAVATSGEAPAPIELNSADIQTLAQLPGVGLALANRIVEYRARQPFQRPEDLMKVSGIGATTYRNLADRIAVTVEPAPATPTEPPEPKTLAEPAIESSAPSADLSSAEPGPLPAPEPSLVKTPLPTPASQPEERTIPLPSTTPSTEAPTRDWNGLMTMSLLGALLGMIFTLLLLAGINRGTLALNQQGEVTALSAQANDLSTRLTDLESTTKSLRTRLDTLEGLTGRVDELEAALEKTGSDLDALATEVRALNERAEAVAAEVETFRATAERFQVFLNGLRDLLAEVPESPAPTASPGSSTTPTPTP